MATQSSKITRMRLEINEIPDSAARLIHRSKSEVARIADHMRALDPRLIATIARGSSDHAAGFLKYAFELETGLPVASLGPSLASVYDAKMRLEKTATIAISQSGKSPDICAMAAAAKSGGSLTISLVNVITSPLAIASDIALDIQAGPELSVAATKTYVNSVAAGLLVLAAWKGDESLSAALDRLPAALEKAVAQDWSPLCAALEGQNSLYILGRGPSLAIAAEAALKFKETSGLHAEAYSSAEVMHGPVSIVGKGFPVLALIARDKAENNVAAVADQLVEQGAAVFATSSQVRHANRLPYVATGHYLSDALVQIASFYGLIEMLSRQRGLDPDKPRFLRKVTETI